MKKLFGILSLIILLFSTFVPSFTYATGEVGIQAQEILSDTLIDSMNMFENSRGVTSLQQSQEAVNLFGDQEEDQINTNEEADPKIEYDNENKLITITSEKYNHSITLKDKNVGAENVGDYGDYLSFSTTICPTGFHTPSKIEWENLILLYSLIKNNESDFATDFKLPYAGAKQNGNFLGSTVSNLGYYWSSTDWTGGDYNGFYTLIKKEDGTIQTDKYFPKGMFSLTIRCFKDNNEKIKLVKFNPNGGAFSGMRENKTKIIKYTYNGDEIIPINNIQIPDRISYDMSQQSGWMFDGWYTTAENQTEEFDISNPQTTTAYAKWLPFNDKKINFGNTSVVIMDRNLGARDYASGYTYGLESEQNSLDRRGKYFQWGNNYGFVGDSSINNGLVYNKTSKQISDTSMYGPENSFYNSNFISNGRSYYKWSADFNTNLWGGDNPLTTKDSNRKGPCPEGYHVPTDIEWNYIYNLFRDWKVSPTGADYCDSITNGNSTNDQYCFTAKLGLPYASTVSWYDGEKSETNFAYYWSSSTYNNENAIHLSCGRQGVNVDNGYSHSGFPVRCFKDDNNLKSNIVFESNGGNEITDVYTTTRRREAINLPSSDEIMRENMKFYGRYTTEDYDEDSKVTTTSIDDNGKESIKLYAKWGCNSGYTFNEELNTCEPISLVFNANGGKFADNNDNYIITSETVKVSSDEILYSHTPNITDMGEQIANYDNNLKFTEVITITGAKSLNIKITFGGYSQKYDYVAMWTGSHPGYNAYNNYDNPKSILGSEGKLGGGDHNSIFNTKEYKVDGDTVTFAFNSDIGGGDGFGYYAVIREDDSYETHYSGDLLNSIPEPVREGYVFKGWFLDNSSYDSEFDLGLINLGKSMNVYAKWEMIRSDNPSSAGGGSVVKNNNLNNEEDNIHNSADNDKFTNDDSDLENEILQNDSKNKSSYYEIDYGVKRTENKSLTRGEVAVMTNILLEVFPQLVEGKQELDDVTNACSFYADEQSFTKDEKKAITRLCKLSIMGIHNDTNKPLEEFLVNNKSTNDEFSKVINRSIETYNKKDLSTIKEALKKLEGDEENVVFGTVYEVFMGIKNIFN